MAKYDMTGAKTVAIDKDLVWDIIDNDPNCTTDAMVHREKVKTLDDWRAEALQAKSMTRDMETRWMHEVAKQLQMQEKVKHHEETIAQLKAMVDNDIAALKEELRQEREKNFKLNELNNGLQQALEAVGTQNIFYKGE